jgi:UDP-glucose 4-epimerase
LHQTNMSLYWITGARGFLGGHLARLLARQGHKVIGVGHGQLTDTEAAEIGLAGWLNASVSTSSLDLLLLQYGLPDTVFQLAGGSAVEPSLRAPLEDFQRTVASMAALLDWVRVKSPDTKIVLASSAAVYGAWHNLAIAETVTPSPTSPYGYHKYCAELLTQEYAHNFQVSVSIVRLFSVYGPGLRKQLLWDIAKRLKINPERIELGGNGDEQRDWLYVDDAVDLLARASTWAATSAPVVNGGTGVATSVRTTVEAFSGALEIRPEISFTGKVRAGDPRVLVANPMHCASLGFRASTSLATGLRQTAAWLSQALTL